MDEITSSTSSRDVPIQYVSVGPGAICPTCHEQTPNEHALEMRRWRAKRKSKTHASAEEKRDA